MAIGWLINLAEANTYFTVDRLETVFWDNASNALRTKALENAHNRILYHDDYEIPASPSPAQLVKLKMAQEEMAYYLLIHLADEDRRKGIQVQGVVKAGIVKEDYDKDLLLWLPIPPFVDDLLSEFKKAKAFFKVDIDRDEEESVDENVTDY